MIPKTPDCSFKVFLDRLEFRLKKGGKQRKWVSPLQIPAPPTVWVWAAFITCLCSAALAWKVNRCEDFQTAHSFTHNNRSYLVQTQTEGAPGVGGGGSLCVCRWLLQVVVLSCKGAALPHNSMTLKQTQVEITKHVKGAFRGHKSLLTSSGSWKKL